MGLVDSIIGSVVGGNGGQQRGGANPLVSVLMSLLAARAGGGGLGGMLSNVGSGLGGNQSGPGGLLGGGGAGELGALIKRFTQAGHGGVINSWIGNGQSQPIAPHDLGAALGPETVGQLSQLLPGVVDQLTPQGRMPTEQEHAHW